MDLVQRTDTIAESEDGDGMDTLGDLQNMEIQKSEPYEEQMDQDSGNNMNDGAVELQALSGGGISGLNGGGNDDIGRARPQSIMGMGPKSMSMSSEARSDQLLIEKMNIESGFCPKRHRLRKTQVHSNRKEAFICDYCNSFVEINSTVYVCYQKDTNCNFELCSQCYLDIRLEHGINYKDISVWFQELPKARKQLKWSKLVYNIYLEAPKEAAAMMDASKPDSGGLFAISEDDDEDDVKAVTTGAGAGAGAGGVYLNLGGAAGSGSGGDLSSLAANKNKNKKKNNKNKKGHRQRRNSVSSIATSTAGRDRQLRTFALSTKKQINEFMANFIRDYIETRDYSSGGSSSGSGGGHTKFNSNKSKNSKQSHAKLDTKVLMTYLKSDSNWVSNKLETKNWQIGYKFFLSNQFVKLLNQLHYQRVDLSSVILSPYGHTMKRYDGVNPPDSVEHEWHCRLCQCECDMSTPYSPQYIYWCPLSRVLLCPAHGNGGAPAQSKPFVQEISKVFLELLKFYDIMLATMPNLLGNMFRTATKITNRNVDISNSEQLKDVSQAIVKTYFTQVLNGGNNNNNSKLSLSDIEKDIGYQNIGKHMLQCGDWIFNDAKRREQYALSEETFLKTDRFKKIILAYYWEYDEEQNAERTHHETEFNIWKYIEYWLERMNMTEETLQAEIAKGNIIYIWRIDCFLVGIPEPQSVVMMEASQSDGNNNDNGYDTGNDSGHDSENEEKARKGTSANTQDSFIQELTDAAAKCELKDTFLRTHKDKLPVGLREFDRLMAHLEHLDVMVDKTKAKKEIAIDVNWVKIGEFMRNTSIEYRRLLLREWFPSINETIRHHNTQDSQISRSALRCIIFHFVQTFYERNWYECPDIIIDEMLFRDNNVEQVLDYLCNETRGKPINRNKRGLSRAVSTATTAGVESVRESKQLNASLADITKHWEDKYYPTLPKKLRERPKLPKIFRSSSLEPTYRVTFWDFVFTDRLSDLLIDYFYLRVGWIERLFKSNQFTSKTIPENVYGRALNKLYFDGDDEDSKEDAKVVASKEIPKDLNHISIKLSAMHESGKHHQYNVNDFNEHTSFEDLQFHYRLMRRHPEIEGRKWSLMWQSRRGEESAILRFRISSIETPVIIRFGNSPHSYLYELTLIPSTSEKLNRKRLYLTKLMFGSESHVKREMIEPECAFEINNHFGQWFTVYYRENIARHKGQLYLFGEWIPNVKECEKYVRDLRRSSSQRTLNSLETRLKVVRETHLIFEKHISANLLYWIGFAGYGHDFTVSTPDFDAKIMESWTKWSDFTGIMDDPNEEDQYLVNDNNNNNNNMDNMDDDNKKNEMGDKQNSIPINGLGASSSDKLGNSGKHSEEAKDLSDSEDSSDDEKDGDDGDVDNDDEISDEAIHVTKEDVRNRIRKEFNLKHDCHQVFLIDQLPVNIKLDRVWPALIALFDKLNPIIRPVPSLSTMSEFGVEFKTKVLVPTCVIREHLETDSACVQELGKNFCCIEQIEYDTIRMDKELWEFCEDFYKQLIVSTNETLSAQATKTKLDIDFETEDRLSEFLIYAFDVHETTEEAKIAEEEMLLHQNTSISDENDEQMFDVFVKSAAKATKAATNAASKATRMATTQVGNLVNIGNEQIKKLKTMSQQSLAHGFTALKPNVHISHLNKDRIGGNQRDSVAIQVYKIDQDDGDAHLIKFSFDAIREMNAEFYDRLVELIAKETMSKVKERMERVRTALTSNPIWPHIEIKLSRHGTIEQFETNKLSYIWRGGSTLTFSLMPLPLIMQEIQAAGGNNNNNNNNSNGPNSPKSPPSRPLSPGATGIMKLGTNTEYRRLLYYEVVIERAGLDKSICIGAGLGPEFTYLLSSTVPGKRPYTWGLSGSHGRLFDQNKKDVAYGPSFHDNLVIGCGFLLTTPEASGGDQLNSDNNENTSASLDEEKYTSNLFFTYNGFQMKLYPDNDASESILPGNILHRIKALCSTGSEDCLFKFNFGPKFEFEIANQAIDQLLFEKARLGQTNQTVLGVDRIVSISSKLEQAEYDPTPPQPDGHFGSGIGGGGGGSGNNLVSREAEAHWDGALLNENEEEILSELILEFENDKDKESKKLLRSSAGTGAAKSMNRSHYLAIYNKVIMSYYFYMKGLESMDESDLYELLVQFDLLDLATKLNDAQITGKNFLDLRRYVEDQSHKIEEYYNQNEENEIFMDIAQLRTMEQLINTWENGEPKHKELLRSLQLAMHDLNVKLYERNIVPSSKHGLGNSNVPPALWELVDEDVGSMGQGSSHENMFIQEYLLKLWRLISQHRRTNQSEGLSIVKQEFFLDFLAFYLNSENLMSLISQLLINWSRGANASDSDNDTGNSFTAKHELHILLSGFVRGSNNPLSTALQMAGFLEDISDLFPEIEEHTKELSIECQKMAINVLDSITSNRLAIIVLESNDSLDIALESGLDVFISSPKVVFLRQAIWTRCSVALLPSSDIDNGEVEDSEGEIATWISSLLGNYLHVLTLEHGFSFVFELLFQTKHQLNWFFSPIGKVQTEFFIYLTYCALLYYVVAVGGYDAYSKDDSNEMPFYEIVFWICNFSFILAEIRNANVIGLGDYMREKENWIDMFIDSNYLILFVLRMIGFWGPEFGFAECSSENTNNCLINTFFATFFILMILGIISRISYMVLVFYNMGFLVRSLVTMGKDILNFLVFVLLWIIGFTLAMYMGTLGVTEGYETLGGTFRTLFYAMLGDFDWGPFGETDGVNSTRIFIMEIVFIVWLTFGLIIFLNFIIAVMGKRFDTVQEEVNKYVSMHRMNVLRSKDELPPTIPAPFQTILPIFEFFWFLVIEPTIWLFTGKIVNVEYFLCRFDHWDDFDKHHRTHGNKRIFSRSHKYASAKPDNMSWLMTPHFIEYRDQIEGRRLVLPRSFWQRLKTLGRAWKEMRTGMFFTGNSKDELSDPFIWICVYCSKINIGFDKEHRRKHYYSDVIRYYRYNDTLPPEFGFSDKDIQFLEHIGPELCDNCFRVKHWEQRHLFIDALVSFYLYNTLSFVLIRCSLGLFMFGLFVGLTLLSVALTIVFGILALLSYIFFKIIDTIVHCFKCCNCCCCNNEKEKVNKAMRTSLQTTVSENDVQTEEIIEDLNVTPHALLQDKNNDKKDNESDNIGESGEKEDLNSIEQIKLQKKMFARLFFIDYKNMYDNMDYELMLLVPFPKLTLKEANALKKLLNETMKVTGLTAQRDNLSLKNALNFDVLLKRLKHNSDPIYNISTMVENDICKELTTRIVLLRATYQACAKFKECLDKILYVEQQFNSKKHVSYVSFLPQFTLKLLASRYSVEANWGINDESNYHAKVRTRASKQTRSKYEFSFSPVLNTINHSPS